MNWVKLILDTRLGTKSLFAKKCAHSHHKKFHLISKLNNFLMKLVFKQWKIGQIWVYKGQFARDVFYRKHKQSKMSESFKFTI